MFGLMDVTRSMSNLKTRRSPFNLHHRQINRLCYPNVVLVEIDTANNNDASGKGDNRLAREPPSTHFTLAHGIIFLGTRTIHEKENPCFSSGLHTLSGCSMVKSGSVCMFLCSLHAGKLCIVLTKMESQCAAANKLLADGADADV